MKYWFIGVIAFIVAVLYLNSDAFNLTCIVARSDGNTYCVRESDRIQDSVELLAEATRRMTHMVNFMKRRYPSDPRVKLLTQNYNPHKIVETLPTSEYTAYSENKGTKLAFCLRKYKDKMKLIDINTLTFVALHELTHLMTASIGHEKDFWENFKFMLENAVAENMYDPINYSKEPSEYCGLKIDSNPLY
jgi:hypothetical protein